MTLAIIVTSCEKDSGIAGTRSGESDTMSKLNWQYQSLCNRKVISALSIARYGDPLRAPYRVLKDDEIYGLTETDVQYIMSLDTTQLKDLRNEIMDRWDIESIEKAEEILDRTYEKLTKDFDADQLADFNSFLGDYLDMPAGMESFGTINAHIYSVSDFGKWNPYVFAAAGIDIFARGLYEAIQDTRSAQYCRYILNRRLAITALSTFAGALLPGYGWAVVATAVFDVIDARNRYLLCLRTRGNQDFSE